MKYMRRSIGLLGGGLAALVWMISAVGYALAGIPGVMEHFGTSQTSYWYNRLLASQLTGVTLFALMAVVAGLATYLLHIRHDKLLGRTLSVLVVAVGVITMVQLLSLTPQDISHAIPFIIATAAAAVGLAAPSTPPTPSENDPK
jgi:hypothetical protein